MEKKRVYVFCQVKGGVGKSLSAQMWALYLHHVKKFNKGSNTTLLIDGDHQGSIMDIVEDQETEGVDISQALPVESFNSLIADKWIKKIEIWKEKYNHIVIDLGGSWGSDELEAICQSADYIISPTIPKIGVFRTCLKYFHWLVEITRDTETKILVFSNFHKRTKEAQEIVEVLEDFEGVTMIGTLPERIAYSRHQDLTTFCKDEYLEKLMKSIFKQTKL